MRKPFMAGNWKMNLTLPEAIQLAREVVRQASALSLDVALTPPACFLESILEICRHSPVAVAGQNCHWEPNGAFTGEISSEMLSEIGCQYVLIGHSERRQYFQETDESVRKKVKAAFRANLLPIVCVGETLQEREAQQTQAVVARQVKGALPDLSNDQARQLTLAYEPVWAIGTGKTASPEQAQEVHRMIRDLLGELFGSPAADKIRIQYGGSVKPSNIRELMAQPDVDGALVGGASLDSNSFLKIIQFDHGCH